MGELFSDRKDNYIVVVTVQPWTLKICFAICNASGDDKSIIPWALYAREISSTAVSKDAFSDGGKDGSVTPSGSE